MFLGWVGVGGGGEWGVVDVMEWRWEYVNVWTFSLGGGSAWISDCVVCICGIPTVFFLWRIYRLTM